MQSMAMDWKRQPTYIRQGLMPHAYSISLESDFTLMSAMPATIAAMNDNMPSPTSAPAIAPALIAKAVTRQIETQTLEIFSLVTTCAITIMSASMIHAYALPSRICKSSAPKYKSAMVNVEWTNHIPSLSSFFMTASVGMSSWQNCQFLCRRICPTPLFVKQIFTRDTRKLPGPPLVVLFAKRYTQKEKQC